MTPRAQKVALWLALFALLPLPVFFPQDGLVPALRMAFVAALMCAVAIADGAGGLMALFAVLPLVHALVYSLLLWLLASLVVRLNGNLAPRSRTLVTAGIALALLGAASFEIYRTPLSSSGPYSNVTGLLD